MPQSLRLYGLGGREHVSDQMSDAPHGLLDGSRAEVQSESFEQGERRREVKFRHAANTVDQYSPHSNIIRFPAIEFVLDIYG